MMDARLLCAALLALVAACAGAAPKPRWVGMTAPPNSPQSALLFELDREGRQGKQFAEALAAVDGKA